MPKKKETVKAKKKVKKKVKKVIPKIAKAFIQASFNNTLVTITDEVGDTLFWGSAGSAGFKGTRKSTPFAATIAVKKVAEKAKKLGIEALAVFVKGPGLGRDASIRALKNVGLHIVSISDITPIPHNGCRPRKRRRT